MCSENMLLEKLQDIINNMFLIHANISEQAKIPEQISLL